MFGLGGLQVVVIPCLPGVYTIYTHRGGHGIGDLYHSNQNGSLTRARMVNVVAFIRQLALVTSGLC